MLTITRLAELMTIDPRHFSRKQLDHCQQIFDDFQDKDFLPANEAYRDDMRIALDTAVLVTQLGVEKDLLENLAILRKQWCSELSVHGGKHTKP